MHMPYIYIYTISYVHAIFLHHKFKVNLQVFHFHRGRQQAERLADSWPNGWKKRLEKRLSPGAQGMTRNCTMLKID